MFALKATTKQTIHRVLDTTSVVVAATIPIVQSVQGSLNPNWYAVAMIGLGVANLLLSMAVRELADDTDDDDTKHAGA